MPIIAGVSSHRIYRIPDVPRDRWIASIPARKIALTDSRLVATLRVQSVRFAETDAPRGPLLGHGLHVIWSAMRRGASHFSVEAEGKKVEAIYGPEIWGGG